jgi:hypothetical protein
MEIINYSNVFAKIDIPRPLEFVYQHLLDSGFITIHLKVARISRIKLSLVCENDIIGHIVTSTSLECQVIEMLDKTQILPEKLIQEEC